MLKHTIFIGGFVIVYIVKSYVITYDIVHTYIQSAKRAAR